MSYYNTLDENDVGKRNRTFSQILTDSDGTNLYIVI